MRGVPDEHVEADEWYRRRMMYRARRLSGAALAITMLFAALALALSGSAGAQEDQTVEVSLTESRDSGVSGTATLEDVKGGVKVTLEMRNLPEPGIKHINHIHAGGTCADDRAGRTAPVTIPLKTITAQDDGTGSATTTIEDVSVAQLFGEDKERFILLHAEAKKGEGVPPGIACADLAPLADTGGIRPATLFLAGAISILGVAAGLFVLQRCIGAEN
jgi:Cu/Zn superoxide dismutase